MQHVSMLYAWKIRKLIQVIWLGEEMDEIVLYLYFD